MLIRRELESLKRAASPLDDTCEMRMEERDEYGYTNIVDEIGVVENEEKKTQGQLKRLIQRSRSSTLGALKFND